MMIGISQFPPQESFNVYRVKMQTVSLKTSGCVNHRSKQLQLWLVRNSFVQSRGFIPGVEYDFRPLLQMFR